MKDQTCPIVVLARRTVSEDAAPGFMTFVEDGGTLVVMTNRIDLRSKAPLLKLFKLDVLQRHAGIWRYIAEGSGFENALKLDTENRAVVSLDIAAQPDDLIVVNTASGPGETNHEPSPVIISRRIGKGRVIMVGSMTMFTNQNLHKYRNYRVLDALVALGRGEFDDR